MRSEDIGIAKNPTIWKISIGEVCQTQMRDYYIANGESRVGWNHTGNLAIDLNERASN